VAMFDDGTGGTGALGKTVPQQLQALGVTGIEHHFCSHYHSDHLGGTPSVVNAGIPITNAWDRGLAPFVPTTAAYLNYVAAIGTHRKTLVKGQVITLDSLSAHPVQLKCVDLAGAGITVSSGDENSLSIEMKVTYGEFDMTFGGDLPGQTGSYKNIETTVGPEVGHVEVYKAHHHGSATSSLDDWLNATTPLVAVISCGNGNSYGHPTAAALTRLHNHGVKTYWTETGAGAAPLNGWDKVSNGQIAISATWEGAGVDTIRGNGFTDTFINSGTAPGDVVAPLASMLSPNGGEVLKAGSSQSVTWSASDNVAVTTVDLDWSADGGATWSAIATGIANTGSYAWTVPAQATTAGRVRVRARDAAGNLGADSSASSFTVDFWTVTASAGPGDRKSVV
jgi:beta-lactamase superfamily II metal-dependent hydrolase